MNEAYMIMCYNEATAGFGYIPRPFCIEGNLTKAAAKSIARHFNKIAPSCVQYRAEPEPERWI